VKQSPTISVKPISGHWIKRESPSLSNGPPKEVFDVGILKDPENPDSVEIKETVRLVIDPETKTARTAAESAISVTVDPSKLKRIQVEGENSARVVKMVYTDDQKQTLVFAPSDVGHGVQNGFIHARRFCRWVSAVAPSVDYANIA
jgi:hypothetical protein